MDKLAKGLQEENVEQTKLNLKTLNGWKQFGMFLLKDLFTGWGKFERWYAITLITLQIVFYIIYPESPLGFITGLSGTICVLLVAKRKLSNYFFGFIQTGIALFLGAGAGLIGETGENLFYFVSQILGLKEWNKHKDEDNEVITKKFTFKQWLLTLVVIAVPTTILTLIFGRFNGTQPLLDALTLVIALVAQTLMVYRFKEQWLLWLALNLVSLAQWFMIGNMSLVAMYIAFTINTVYGYVNWSNEVKNQEMKMKELEANTENK